MKKHIKTGLLHVFPDMQHFLKKLNPVLGKLRGRFVSGLLRVASFYGAQQFNTFKSSEISDD
jgi:hypothetical protein